MSREPTCRARRRDVIRGDDRRFRTAACDRTTDTVLPAGHLQRHWRERWIVSQQLYFATVRPTEHADAVVHNDEIQQPGGEVRPP